MFRRKLLATLPCFATIILDAQTPATQVPVRPKMVNVSPVHAATFDSQLVLLDPNNKAFNRDYSDVNGSPFLFDEFKLARVVLAGGRRLDSIRLRLDIEKHELHYLSGNTVFIINPGKVSEVEFAGSEPGQSLKFRCDYPGIDNQDEHSFYQILAEGKIGLLKVSRKKFTSTKNEMSGEIENRFELYEDFYATAGSELKRLKRDKAFILLLFADHKEKIETYFKEKKPDLKSAGDLAALFTYYNSL